jgi:cell division protein FtsI/penicillin-binding protein 2
MNKTIRRTSVFCLFLVLSVLLRATWLQVVEAKALADSSHNRRTVIAKYAQPLGNIVVAGRPVTGSAPTGGGSDLAYKRTYTDGPLYAGVTGYTSQVYGATQLEGIYQSVLNGSDDQLRTVQDTLTGERPKPGDVITTIDPAVQKAAYAGLGGKHGAAVAIDPATGRILAVVSTPSYDPSKISGSLTSDGTAWASLTGSKDQPMLNRALRQTYPPGSTFKLIVAASALENGLYGSITEPTDSPNPYTAPGTTTPVTNEEADLPCKNASIEIALRYSCNTVFAKMAVQLGQAKVRATAEKFGFNSASLDVPVRVAESVYPKGMDQPQTALSGFGQFDDTATPMQMAMVVAAIANGGQLAAPHLVTRVTDGNGNVLQSYKDGDDKRVISASTAEQLRQAMIDVVQNGTGTNARISGVEVGGKTGTAQNGENNSGTPYAWFVSYAKGAGGKEVAVAVVVEQSDAARAEVSGNGLAAPIARDMMRAALSAE